MDAEEPFVLPLSQLSTPPF
ncbi:uncharacterized protein G2W53_000598 [Senna tora]|uniref:Uncharacterized protein n=1 Tax=Senna tora TaxID=362788 RepID=A0A834XFN3_9FABA|nr:uncharacterized protein G2W53_000598 [Senna tora]